MDQDVYQLGMKLTLCFSYILLEKSFAPLALYSHFFQIFFQTARKLIMFDDKTL